MIVYEVATKEHDTESFPQHTISDLKSGIILIVFFSQEKPLPWKEINTHTHKHTHTYTHTHTTATTIKAATATATTTAIILRIANTSQTATPTTNVSVSSTVEQSTSKPTVQNLGFIKFVTFLALHIPKPIKALQ